MTLDQGTMNPFVSALRLASLSLLVAAPHPVANRAEFVVSESGAPAEAAPVRFGKVSFGGKRWTGSIPKSGDYFIHVVAHPVARYRLTVLLR